VTDADVVRAVEDGSFESLLVRFDAKVGECYFIPGGLVHAIGEGTSVFEVQQSSNTTFRLYDWGRLDANGNPRQLHVKEALAAMDLSLPPPVPGDFVECRYFTFRKVESGLLSADTRRRVVYCPSADVLKVVEPLATCELPDDAFEVLLP
jgi:mannose-6-phosphate isomerase